MRTALARIWTKAGLLPRLQQITLRRHKAELRALQTARYKPALAIFPIFVTVGIWLFLLAGAPIILSLLMHVLSSFGLLLGTLVFALHSVFGLVALIFVAPWFFR